MAGFMSLLQTIRKEAFTERDKGTRFERLICNYLKTSRKYSELLDSVWMWENFPFRKDFGGKDTGIDLVAKTKTNEYWAIQCKCYAEDTVIDKPAVDSFLATSSRTFLDENGNKIRFSNRLWIATTEKWGKNAEESIQNQDPPVTVLNAFDIEADTTVDWDKLDNNLHGFEARLSEKRSPRSHQLEAMKKAHEYYKAHDRGKLIMACGTGKTYTSLQIVEQETNNKGLILVLVPSIALINQTLNEWYISSKETIYSICVCSDSTASRQRKNSQDDSTENINDLAMPACTNAEKIAQQLITAKETASGMIVVYSTYQSIEVISEAQKNLMNKTYSELFINDKNFDFTFDYIVCDEAHRTTGATIGGKDESAFVKVHDNNFIKAHKRLYMTATPRIYGEAAKKKAEETSVILCSMDDEKLYGKEFYRIGFGEAVEKGLLSDYKVLILTVRDNIDMPVSVLEAIQDKEQEIQTDDAVKLVGCINALSKRVEPGNDLLRSIDPTPMHRAVAFCPRIKDSKAITKIFNTYAKEFTGTLDDELQTEIVNIESQHIDGGMNAEERNRLITWLREAPTSGNDCRILTNVRCLSEGVDVPSLDAVIFLSARNSQVDVVQSVGRVMRTAPGKKYGYIIIPVVIPAKADPNTVLNNNKEYGVIWTVLNALRAHDDRFNAYVNKLELNEQKPTGAGTVTIGSGIIGNMPESDEISNDKQETYQMLKLFDDKVQLALYAKMVLKVGTKRYWEQWADDIAKIAKRHMERINRLINEDENYQTAFEMYLDGLHKNINPNIDRQEAIEMLAQHMITKPVFEALFENYSFAENNPISIAMKTLLDLVEETAYEKDQSTMERFYKSVRERCEGIDNADGKQKIIVELYDKFFKKALPTTVDKLGIVYTPVEVVDFINQSVADILKKEFNRNISDENIHIIDPFTGTGTFITRLIQSGLIKQKALERKYKHELHANEIVLLAYYIASINIENAYHDATQAVGGYTPFNGICLTDTFQLYEDKDNDVTSLKYSDVFPQNSERVIEQSKTPIQIIIGNPPYSVGQKSANDNAQNESYPKLEKRIEETYGKISNSTLQKGLYDSYVKAFRWASDRIDKNNGGIIGFITNASWLDGAAMDGLRKCFEEEFSSIYVYNLRGNARTQGEIRRKEKDNVFGQGSRAPIAITVLVKNPKAKNIKADIYYRDIGDYLTREEKFKLISNQKSVSTTSFIQQVIKPNDKGDWLNQRNESFSNYIQLSPTKKFDEKSQSYFSTFAIGLATNRDAWDYNYSKTNLNNYIKKMISFYNSEVENYIVKSSSINDFDIDNFINTNPLYISWTRKLKNNLKNKILHKFKDNALNISCYRPFNKLWLYNAPEFIESPGLWHKLYPKTNTKNLVICVSGIGGTKNFSCLIINKIVCLDAIEKTQCFPLYWYEEKTEDPKQQNIFELNTNDEPEITYEKHDGVTDFILNKARSVYKTNSITKEDIFYYVYGLLHSPDYRNQFAADLKKMLPRIPLVNSAADFKAFSSAGRELADLHLNYEKRQPPKEVEVEGDTGNNYLVEKMKFKSKDDKTQIIYNNQITIKNIPLEAYGYVINGRSAIEWIMERYRVKIDKDSQIKNDPNDWAREHNDPRYILDLLLSIITVSLETVKIVNSLPKLKFE